MALQRLTLEAIAKELNETLRRKEEARIYHWQKRTGQFPPPRARVAPPPAPGTGGESNRPP